MSERTKQQRKALIIFTVALGAYLFGAFTTVWGRYLLGCR